MAYRYTNTDKWNDAWFSKLKKLQKLLFLYICDNCDIAGFIEINEKRWKSDLEFSESELKGAIEGLSRGLIYSNTNDCIFIRNFLKHQKNLPLNEKNNAHLGIIKRLESYLYKFNYNDINEFILAPSEPLVRGYGNGKGNGAEITLNWRSDFEIYKKELNTALIEMLNDKQWFSEKEKFNPNLDIKLTLEKCYSEFWGLETGWKHKKKSKSNEIDWRATMVNAISQKQNKVYKQTNLFNNGNDRRNISELDHKTATRLADMP